MLIGFIIGLSSAFHCLGMCGPIALAIPVNRSSNFTILSGAFQYNLGRIAAYTALGLVAGSIGLSFLTLQWMQWLSVAAGLLMILLTWHKLFASRQSKWEGKLTQQISSKIGKVIRSKSPFKLIGLGVLNGLLPCGMIFIGLTNALIQGSPFKGALAMTFFGLGTLPVLFPILFFASKLSGQRRLQFSKATPYMMTIVGVLVILRGLNLGIPYISPEINMVQTKNTLQKPKVEMVCCTSSPNTAENCSKK